MPKVTAPEAPKKIKVKAVGGAPKKITVNGLKPAKKPIMVSKMIKTMIDHTTKLHTLECRVSKDSYDIDTLYINYEQLKTQNETAMVIACAALVLAFVAVILAVA